MVRKIKLIVLLIIFLVLLILAFLIKSDVETNLIRTLLPQNVESASEIVQIANNTSSVIKVVFEAEDENKLLEIKDSFVNNIDKDYFLLYKFDISNLLKKYTSQPANFLSRNMKDLLISQKYEDVYQKGMEYLYNPMGLQVGEFERDPYFLLEDFLISDKKAPMYVNYKDGKYYDYLLLKMNSDEALSPDLSNGKIAELINLKNKLSDSDSEIYLAGTPIHSYYASKNAIININIICLLSTLLVVFLTFFYFRRLKLLLPIALSIIMGMLAGFVAVKLWFATFHVITMVFSTTLIGIGIDYSYHYFFKDSDDKSFVKNLSFSFLTTVVPFSILYFSGVELLKQIAIFTIFGLLIIYLTVLFIYPCFNFCNSEQSVKVNTNYYKIFLIFVCMLSIGGIFKLNIDHSMASLYSPPKNLLNAEKLYNEVSGDNYKGTRVIKVEADNFENLLEKDENIAKEIRQKGIDCIAISDFLPSEKTQEENFYLVKNLYINNSDNYKNILSEKQIQNLKKINFAPVKFKFDDFPYYIGLEPLQNSSMIYLLSDGETGIFDGDIRILDFKVDIEKYINDYQNILLKLFPFVVVSILLILAVFYGIKTAFKIILPSLSGIFFAVCIVSLIMGELNFFSIITIFLLMGFTIDYSIFRAKCAEKTEDAILVSSITTSFSFLMLSFCGFKLLTSMSLMLFWGILISYITGYLLFHREQITARVVELRDENGKKKK